MATNKRNPREDQLTEVFASVLERVDGLAHALALAWLDPDPGSARERSAPDGTEDTRERLEAMESPAVLVDTQVWVGLRRVDLELRFLDAGAPPHHAVRVWVENKHGAKPTDQLDAYVARVTDDVAAGTVVLLAPEADLPFAANVPAEVPQRSWQHTGRICAEFQTDDPVERFLLDEFIAYLREEDLMVPDVLGPEHFTALTYYSQAEQALWAIREHAAVYVDQVWPGPRRREDLPRKGVKYSERYGWPDDTPAPEGLETSWFEWEITHVTRGLHPLEIGGAVFVTAGLSAPKDGTLTPNDSTARWQQALESGVEDGGQRVVFHRWRGDAWRLNRVAYPHEVLAGNRVDEQGEALGRWIVQTFEAIRRAARQG